MARGTRLRQTGRCHLPVASMTTRLRSNRFKPALQLANALARLATRRCSPEGRTYTSSQSLLTSMPTLDLALALVRTLPCLACGTCSLSSVEDKSRRTGGPSSPAVPTPRGHTVPPARAGAGGHRPRAPPRLQRFAPHRDGRSDVQGGGLRLAAAANRRRPLPRNYRNAAAHAALHRYFIHSGVPCT